jgi:hypothetical protein
VAGFRHERFRHGARLCDRGGRLLGVMHELMKREPIFDRREVVSCREDFEREAAEDYWETGASGRRYSRAFVWATLEVNHPGG